MSDGNSKKNKLSWSKKMVTKWFNIKSKSESEDYQADHGVYRGGDVEYRTSISEKENYNCEKSRTDKSSKNIEHIQNGHMNLNNPRIVDVQNYSIFVATWNVGGRSPPSTLSLEDWLHTSAPADIYVLGFQEIVPLNAGNVLGAEDNGPARKWLSLIRKMLNSHPGTSGVEGCYMPSRIPEPVVELNDDFEESLRLKNSSFFLRPSFHTTNNWKPSNDPSTALPQLDGRFSISNHVILDHRPSDYESSFRWGHRLSNYTRQSDYCRQSNESRPSDYSKWGSSEDDGCLGDSTSDAVFSPPLYGGSTSKEDGRRMGHQYCLVANKQMVGIFLTIWVRSELKDSIRNMKVSCVGRGLMGYLGNKGSISISMSLHQTSFCFICSHLTSGEKQGDELRRNSDVMEILKKTRFRCDRGLPHQKSPQTIFEHDRIIWFGDLNYRIALSHRSAKALVEMQNWRVLLENDQLRNEQNCGRVFVGWNECNIYFPPTYKYSNNSDQYSGDGIYRKEKRRTPAWEMGEEAHLQFLVHLPESLYLSVDLYLKV
ncbi:type IV inositol polyphosphate 5-phosphatase 7-like isoform X2 [Momordica charantia]|uniref:Type IV inositol polyphosphate 5-phosphatase 7-like isoform X2 n=1 Tax=Momordica charantia TaxID=3673 RepID=A0A6J1CBH0_MOMCH|nr:type IV inositol polyphosphate 5-phosphatase 7-like isoform X2 [Momordica charantia]